jgi:hypothetical protein
VYALLVCLDHGKFGVAAALGLVRRWQAPARDWRGMARM